MRTPAPVSIRLGILVAAACVLASVLLLAAARPSLEDSSSAGTCRFSAHLDGRDEVPPVDTSAQGQFDLTPGLDGTGATFRLNAANIRNVVAAHLHLAPVGQNGPVVATLLGPLDPAGGPIQGEIARGTLTAASLGGPLAGQSFQALVEAMKHGAVYVNVHTSDGVDPHGTEPGDYPGGEIRGQLRPMSHECAGPLLYYWLTCGDPLCFEFYDDPAIPPCTTQQIGGRCFSNGEVCEVGDCENHRIVCQKDDPQALPCPISLASYKRDIDYLDEVDVRRLHDALLSYRLTTYRYKAQGEKGPLRLGFLIDDVGTGPSVAPDGRAVDLYGYTSMAVAAIQEQARQIEALERKVKDLEKRLSAGR